MNHGLPHRKRRGAQLRRTMLPVLLIAQLMAVIDVSAVNVALPHISKGLGIAGGDSGWAITSYTLLFGSLLLLGGRAADLLGRRRMFVVGVSVFTIGSLASSLAGTGGEFFGARAVQGTGAAMLSPAALSILSSAFIEDARARALAAWAAVGGAGAAIGVLAGGFLVGVAGWRAIFFVNLPIGLLLALFALRTLPRDEAGRQWQGLDLRGALLAVSGVGAVVYGVSRGGVSGWASVSTLGFTLAGVFALGLLVALERRVESPLVRAEKLADRAVGGGFVLMLAAAGMLFSVFLLVSLYLQDVQRAGALRAGAAFLPLALAAGAGAHVGGRLVRQFGVRGPMAAGFLAAAAGMLVLARLPRQGGYVADVLPGLVVVGLALGVVLVAVALCVFAGAEDSEAGMLSGLNSTGHELGGTIGVALSVAIASAGAGAHAFAPHLDRAFLVNACVGAVAALVAWLVLPAAGPFLERLKSTGAPILVH